MGHQIVSILKIRILKFSLFNKGPIEIYKLYFIKIFFFLQLQGGCVVTIVYGFIMNLEINLVQTKLNTNVGWLSKNKK
jgi:hypothetical protein